MRSMSRPMTEHRSRSSTAESTGKCVGPRTGVRGARVGATTEERPSDVHRTPRSGPHLFGAYRPLSVPAMKIFSAQAPTCCIEADHRSPPVCSQHSSRDPSPSSSLLKILEITSSDVSIPPLFSRHFCRSKEKLGSWSPSLSRICPTSA